MPLGCGPRHARAAVLTPPGRVKEIDRRENRPLAPLHVITMTSATKILVASSLPAVSNWNNSKTSGGITRVYHQTDGERQGRRGRRRGPDPPRPSPARKPESDRN